MFGNLFFMIIVQKKFFCKIFRKDNHKALGSHNVSKLLYMNNIFFEGVVGGDHIKR